MSPWDDEEEEDDYYDGYEDQPEVDPGCVLGDKCVNPHLYHTSGECASAEDMEAYFAECERQQQVEPTDNSKPEG